MKKIGIYIHIPFCKAKCHYCDFNSHPGREAAMGPYFEALGQEMRNWSPHLSGVGVSTVFIGGGTPSLVDKSHIQHLMVSLNKKFSLDEDAEITIESNPGTLSFEKLKAYRSSGINRLSMGLQAWQDRLLGELGRIHDCRQFLDNLEAAFRAGFSNINADLIFGVPGQTLYDWSETVNNVAALDIPHISCYSLKIEEGTVYGDRLEAGELAETDDELDREMYRLAIEVLASRGLRQYEISNFAKPGFECRHNLIYWRAEEYLGLGAGSHSYLWGERFNNIYNIDSYINNIKNNEDIRQDIIKIDREASMSEFMLLGFRLNDGVSEDEFSLRYGKGMESVFGKQLASLAERKLIVRDHGRIRLTETGLDLANQVFMEFV